MPEPLLFTPAALRDAALKNRVVVAPMHQYAAPRGFATTGT
jgi:2,4-dienoyl-CoA reductase-like NADH-dependent reductase (Old Yellow Enzyme family)